MNVHKVLKARKDYPEHKIKKGETYYWWVFNFEPGRHFSKTPPRRSQLTKSSYLASLWDLEDRIADLKSEGKEDESGVIALAEDMKSELDEIKEELEYLKGEQEERLEAMPDHFKETSPSGELLQERIDELDEWISALDTIDDDYDEESSEEDKKEFIERIISEIQDVGI